VRSDNPALGFYEKFGFQELERVPLIKSKDGNMVVWSEDRGNTSVSPDAPHLVHMTLPPAV
jgi:ribosomal protein S18 acetylase RimI-like enzyme